MIIRIHARALAVLTLLLALAVTGLRGQDAAAERAYQEGLGYAQSGDTILALAEMRRAVDLDPDWAEPYYQIGLLHFRRAGTGGDFLAERIAAHDAFTTALKLDAGNPRYMVELGKLLLMQEIRVDALRVFRRALAEAERADAETLAETHYQLALMRETQWLRFRDRHFLPFDLDQIRGDIAFADPDYVWDILERSRTYADQGRSELDRMLDHLYMALQAQPGHVGAATRLLAFLYDEGRMDEFMAEARRFARAAPQEAKAYLALGLGLHAMGRDDEAAGSFEYALGLMQSELREDFLSVTRLMTQDDAAHFDELTVGDRAEARRRFWLAADPLYITPSNEFWVEYQARMAYADIRFGLPEYKVPGWRTDRGTIWVRYGEPARKATFAPSTGDTGDFEAVGKVTTVWAYDREGPVFLFRQNPGYSRATFANDFAFYADDYRSVQPTRFSAPSIPTIANMEAQVVRFRGSGGQMDLEVHARFPLDSLGAAAEIARGTLETGLFMLDPGGSEIRRITDSEDVEFDDGRLDRSWRVEVPQGRPYTISVEAREPLSWAAAAFRQTVAAKRFPAGSPSVSDILLGSSIRPRVEDPERRSDFDIYPSPTLVYQEGQEIGVYFELYNLVPDEEQFAAYELEVVVTVEEIYREGVQVILGEVADRFGFTEEGGRAVQLEFTREARVLARDMIPEYFDVTLDEPPPGRYSMEITVFDRNANLEFSTRREFEVLRRR